MSDKKIIKINSTNYYLLKCKDGNLLIDAGWVGKYNKFKNILNKIDIDIKSIKYVLLTHHHHDHAALVQELRNESSFRLIVHRKEIDYIRQGITYTAEIKSFNIFIKLLDMVFSPFIAYNYTPIILNESDIIINEDIFDISEDLGIEGKIIHTPGHTPGSISLILPDGDSFVGDTAMNILKIFGQKVRPIVAENYEEVYNSWRKIIKYGAKKIYPSHGKWFPVDELEKCLIEETNI